MSSNRIKKKFADKFDNSLRESVNYAEWLLILFAGHFPCMLIFFVENRIKRSEHPIFSLFSHTIIP